MKPILVSTGEPAGIGPDICLSLAEHQLPLVVLGDKDMLAERAKLLQLDIELLDYEAKDFSEKSLQKNQLTVYPLSCLAAVKAGQLDPKNALYVLKLLEQGAKLCKEGEFSALVTAPVHKAIINQAGIAFSGHTEYFEHYFSAKKAVMMLATEDMRMALATTHLPLQAVPSAITFALLQTIVRELHRSLKIYFGIASPKILVAGLNPHAGESGHLGKEEINIIIPALEALKAEDIAVKGPFPADTLFTKQYQKEADVFLAMYHDQGLPVLKYSGFGQAVNITLGLPIVRTSVDHGTACELAGSGKASANSLLSAVQQAMAMVKAGALHAKN